jgi:hypothetical protein
MTETNNNQPATKGDLADLRTELKTDIRSLSGEVLKTQLRMDTLENNIMTVLRSFKSDLLSSYEASVMKGQMYSQKAMTHGDILSGHEEKLLNHETRLASLESK